MSIHEHSRRCWWDLDRAGWVCPTAVTPVAEPMLASVPRQPEADTASYEGAYDAGLVGAAPQPV